MIQIPDVVPNARESRPIRRGWGLVHWVCLIPANAILVGFVAFAIIFGPYDGWYPAILVLGSWLVSVLGGQWLNAVIADETRKSPAGRLAWTWSVDAAGMRFDTGLQSNAIDWRGVKSVIEERDRFVFLVTPAYSFVLPKRLLKSGQYEELKALVEQVRAAGRLGAGVDSPRPPSDNGPA